MRLRRAHNGVLPLTPWIESSVPCSNGHLAPKHAKTGRCQCCQRAAVLRCMRKRREQPEFRRAEQAFAREYQAKLRADGEDWGSRNKNRHRQMKDEWRRNNLARACANVIKRKTARTKATPTWLSKDHHNQMVRTYELAADMTKATGQRYEVDHIVPLQGRTVSGLHVPWNLRVLTATANNSRPRIWNA